MATPKKTVLAAPVAEPAALSQVDLLALLVDSIGDASFPATLALLCRTATGFESVMISVLFPDQAPVALHDDLTADQSDRTVGPYLNWAYLIGPFYNLFVQDDADCILCLSECAPDDFRLSEYFRRFYAGTGPIDECGILVHCAGGAAIFVSIGTRNQRGRLRSGTLKGLLPVIAALVRRNWPALSPDAVDCRGRMGHHLQCAVAKFGSSKLSNREAEIVKLVLKGHSNKSIANLLKISAETVKVHRKRIYTKLGVTSHGGLFSVFFGALSHTPPGADDDPIKWLPAGFRPAI